jgi:hypothetical protein
MATFNEPVTIEGELDVQRPWTDWIFLRQERDTAAGGFHIHNPWGNSTQPQGSADRNRLEIGYRDGAGVDHWGQLVLHGPSGNVGIGDSAPQQRLSVAGGGARINGVLIGAEPTGYYACSYETVSAADPRFNLRLMSQNAIIFHTGNPSQARVTITATGHLEMLGGDAAEYFDAASDAVTEPGTVMVIDSDGLVRECRNEADKRVVGVVSGAAGMRPAIVMDSARRASSALLALAGKAHCRADASYGPIVAGDLLTTSPTHGHAMRARRADRGPGTVLGKALASLSEGRGLIPMIVALQ